MYTLGINAVFHDSAACIVKDGHLLAAAEEERFTRIKHGKRPVPFSTYELPFNAVDFCLQTAGIHLSKVDHVAYSFDPSFLLEGEDVPALVTLPLQAPPVHDEQPGSVIPAGIRCFSLTSPTHPINLLTAGLTIFKSVSPAPRLQIFNGTMWNIIWRMPSAPFFHHLIIMLPYSRWMAAVNLRLPLTTPDAAPAWKNFAQ